MLADCWVCEAVKSRSADCWNRTPRRERRAYNCIECWFYEYLLPCYRPSPAGCKLPTWTWHHIKSYLFGNIWTTRMNFHCAQNITKHNLVSLGTLMTHHLWDPRESHNFFYSSTPDTVQLSCSLVGENSYPPRRISPYPMNHISSSKLDLIPSSIHIKDPPFYDPKYLVSFPTSIMVSAECLIWTEDGIIGI